MRSLSLRVQLLLSHLGVMLISLLLVGLLAGNTLAQAPLSEAEHALEDVAFVISNQLEEPLKDYLEHEEDRQTYLRPLLAQLATRDQVELSIILLNGEIIATTESNVALGKAPLTAEVHAALNGGDTHEIRWDSTHSEKLYAAVLIDHENEDYGILRLAKPMAPVREAQGRILLTFLLGVMGVSVFIAVAVWVLTNRIAQPIATLTQATNHLAEGHLDTPVNATGSAELTKLAQSFNNMAQRLNDLLANQRAFVANASHELRTPLTSVKLRIEALRDGAAQDPEVAPKFLAEIESEVDRLSKMVNDLLDLSRIEGDLKTQEREEVDLRLLVIEARDAFSVRAGRAAVALETAVPEATTILLGNENQLRRLLDNLLDNAIKFTPPQGKVKLALTQHPAQLKLVVQDSGVGIPPAALPHIFERFYRGDIHPVHQIKYESTGLGLSLVQSIVHAHGGTIEASSAVTQGTTFTIIFPR